MHPSVEGRARRLELGLEGLQVSHELLDLASLRLDRIGLALRLLDALDEFEATSVARRSVSASNMKSLKRKSSSREAKF
jgi:hypothetical protein